MNSIKLNTQSQEPNIKIIFLENYKKQINNTEKRSVNLYFFETIKSKKTLLKLKMKSKKNINNTANMSMIFTKDTMNNNKKNLNNKNNKLSNWESKLKNFTKSKNKEKNYLNNNKLKYQLVIKVPFKKSIKFKRQMKSLLKKLKFNLTNLSLETAHKRKINFSNLDPHH